MSTHTKSKFLSWFNDVGQYSQYPRTLVGPLTLANYKLRNVCQCHETCSKSNAGEVAAILPAMHAKEESIKGGRLCNLEDEQ